MFCKTKHSIDLLALATLYPNACPSELTGFPAAKKEQQTPKSKSVAKAPKAHAELSKAVPLPEDMSLSMINALTNPHQKSVMTSNATAANTVAEGLGFDASMERTPASFVSFF